MAGFTERISVIVDVTSNKATQGLKDFKSAVADAQGFTGKLKAGVGSLGQTFSGAASSPAVMGAAVAAAGKFAIDAANQFSALGVEVGKFADATGLATEDASRWVEVAGDIGIGTDSLTGVFNKLNKSIDPKLFDQLNIAIERTADGSVNVSDTFLNVIQKLKDIRDPAERARVAAQLLGKGWTDVAELVGMSADDIRKQLAAVGDEKVFDKNEVKQARDYRAAVDNLNDAFEKVVLVLGQEVAPALADVADLLANTVGVVGDVKDALGPLGDSGLEAFNKISDAVGGMWDSLFGADDEIEYTGKAVTHLGDAAAQSQRYLGLLAQHTRESADAAIDLTGNARHAREQLKLLQDQIDGRKSFIDLQIGLRDNAQRIKDLGKQFADGKISAEDYYLGVASLSLDSQNAVADYVAEVDSIPEQKKLELVTTLDPASPGVIINGIQTALDQHTFNARVETTIEDRRPGGTMGNPPPPKPVRPRPVPGEVLTESVNGFGRSSGGVTVVVNAPVGANLSEAGRQVADALRAYYRNGGEPV